jgi:outer membrane protein
MKIRMVLPALATLCILPAAFGQAGAAPAGTPMKVGVMNVQVAITSTAEGKQAAAELQSQFTPRQTDLQNMQKQIDEVRNRLQTGQTTLSDDEKARLAREGDQLTRNLQRKQQESQDDFNDAQQDVVNRIGRKLVEILDGYSKQNGLALVLDTSAQQTPVIYASNEIDITQEIIRLYDQKYPVSRSGGSSGAGASSAPRPAAPKPAAPAAPKP